MIGVERLTGDGEGDKADAEPDAAAHLELAARAQPASATHVTRRRLGNAGTRRHRHDAAARVGGHTTWVTSRMPRATSLIRGPLSEHALLAQVEDS